MMDCIEIDRGDFDVVANPVLHTPYEPPTKHWRLNRDTGQAENALCDGRRESGDGIEYVKAIPKKVPEAQTKREAKVKLKRESKKLELEAKDRVHNVAAAEYATQGTEATLAHKRINRLRKIRTEWAEAGYIGCTSTTLDLIHHWNDQAQAAQTNPDAQAPYFCQREAVETMIWLLEAGETHMPDVHREIMTAINTLNTEVNEGILRLAMRMATGSGKTQTMQMIICWLAANTPPGEPVHVLAIAPGITVRERLQDLIPSREGQYQKLAPAHLLLKIWRARIVVTNYHQLGLREIGLDGFKTTDIGTAKKLMGDDYKGRDETDRECLARVLGRNVPGINTENVTDTKWFVINDEAHHCYQPDAKTGEDKADKEIAAIWFRTLTRMRELGMLNAVFDLSATPMWIRQAHSRKQADMFRWVVTNYPLPEAIEAGLVKTPRMPLLDDAGDDYPKYRNLRENAEPKDWAKPKPGRRRRIRPPQLLRDAIHAAYVHYEQECERLAGAWRTDPVAILVAPDIPTAQALYDYIAGKRKKPSDPNSDWEPSEFDLWSNVDPGTGQPYELPPTLLVHSKIGEAKDAEGSTGKAVMDAAEIHIPADTNWKKPRKMAHIRELFNSVGRPNSPGSHIRMVISISMLTEGWDAKNVTHIIGYRTFGSQLLCEQVVGRGLRRSATAVPNPETGRYEAEAVNVYGVPFDFLAKVRTGGKEPPKLVDIRPDPDRAHLRIEVPQIAGYRVRLPEERLALDLDKVEPFDANDLERLSPGMTLLGSVVLEDEVIAAEGVVGRSVENARARIAAHVVHRWLEHDPEGTIGAKQLGLLRAAMRVIDEWLNHPEVNIRGVADLSQENIQAAIAEAVTRFLKGETLATRITAIGVESASRTDTVKSTGSVNMRSAQSRVRETVKSELPKAVCDSKLEMDMAEILDHHPDIEAWCRNVGLGFTIPYTDPQTGRERDYAPDFIARLTPSDAIEPVHLILETKGIVDDKSIAKARTATEFWCPGVTNSTIEASDGHWHYAMITGDEDLVNALDAAIRKARSNA